MDEIEKRHSIYDRAFQKNKFTFGSLYMIEASKYLGKFKILNQMIHIYWFLTNIFVL